MKTKLSMSNKRSAKVRRSMKIKKGDDVVVIAGNDKGKQGTVRTVLREDDRVIVEGINLRWKHKKPSQTNPKGERTQIECSIHASNVMLLDPSTGKPTRKRPSADAKQKQPAAKPAKAAKKSGK
jgi:large subunit ribosomal protein L24